MRPPKLPGMAYHHDAPLRPSVGQIMLALLRLLAILLAIGVVGIALFLLIEMWVFAVLAGSLIAWHLLSPAARITLGPRYMTCADQIIYYRNITNLELHQQQDLLRITYGDGQTLIIARDRFDTAARKKDKIAANKQAKFEKFTKKLVNRVRYFAPHAQSINLPEDE